MTPFGGSARQHLAWALGASALLAASSPGWSQQVGADPSPVPVAGSAEALLAEGDAALRNGALEQGAGRFAAAAESFAASGSVAEQSAALLRLGETEHALGRTGDAIASLKRALSLAEAAGEDRHRAAVLGALGNAYVARGKRDADGSSGATGSTPEDARRALEQGIELAKQAQAPELAAAILINHGNQLSFSGAHEDAMRRYQEAAELARSAGDGSTEAKALANASRTALASGALDDAFSLLERGLPAARELPASHDKAYLLVNLARSYQRLAVERPALRRDLLLRAWEALSAAGDLASRLGDARAESYAWGYLGTLYEEQNRPDEALELTRRALLAAQRVDAPESLYRWQWQAGRLLAVQGDLNGAARSYGGAVETLQEIRQVLPVRSGRGGSAFRQILVPVYYGRVDLLLRAARETQQPDRRQALLEAARKTVELLKADELRDYFRDECVLQVKETPLDELEAAIVYPIILEDRIEFIVSFAGRLEAFSTPVGAEALTREVRTLRHLLEKRTTHEYLPHSQKLYDWLVRPYSDALAKSGLETLVIVPDDPLRTIPLAALHDGERFLIARYALATAPGMTLIEPAPLDRSDGLKALLTGLSQPRQGSPALEHVPEELAAVGNLYASRLLLDEQFKDQRVEEALEDRSLSIVHMASHGQFEANFKESYLQTYDGRLTMDELEESVSLFRFRENPLELLTLSACETAAGDDRAALGLAGVAVKAGARSVVATLWSVSDQAAAALIGEFYRSLRDPDVSRAAALQRAQTALIADPGYSHPAYWSPFILISNWL